MWKKCCSIAAAFLMLCVLTGLAGCGPKNSASQPATLPAGDSSVIQAGSKSAGAVEADIPGSVSPCGVHNDQPFYVGYAQDFGAGLSALAAVDFTEDVPHADDAKQVVVYVPGSSTRVAIVNIDYDVSSDSFVPLNNVGWAKLGADQYLLFPATIPTDVANIAVVVYSDDWETQQAFALTHSDATGLVLTPTILDE